MSDFNEIYNDFGNNQREYDKEKYAEFKKQEKQEIYELLDKTSTNIIENNKAFQNYLDSQSKFEGYSVGNALLVSRQAPNATKVKDIESWNEQGLYLKKSPNKIKILEPGNQYMREDGSTGISYNVKYVYDISEVKTKQKLRAMRYDDKLLLKAFLNSSYAKVEIVNEIPNTNKKALYDREQEVLYIARGAEAPNIFYDVTTALATQEIEINSKLDNFKIECVSYMLCKKYNIDVSKFDIEVPEELKGLEPKEVRNELEPMRDAMENINARMQGFIRSISRENKEKFSNVR